jgi:oxygen-dependent protoporphyrinogen oxidase
VQITVVEATSQLGGKLRLGNVGGVSTDAGAESLLTRRPEALTLVDDVGWSGSVVHPATRGASLWLDGGMRPLPRHTMLGVPQDLNALASSGVLSTRALLRLPLDRLMRPTPFREGQTVDDIAIGAARVGREVVARLVEPLLGGVYAGHADDLSFAATLPELARETQVQGSLLQAAALLRRRQVDDRPVFATLTGGLGRLPEQVAAAAGAVVRLNTSVTGLLRRAGGWALELAGPTGPERVTADAVVLAVAAHDAAELLADTDPAAAADLAGIDYASVALISYLVPRAAVRRPLVGTGFLVPPAEDRIVKAATFASRKWQWVAEQAPLHEVIRCSVGRYGETHHLERDDADLAWAAWGELASATDIDGSPEASTVTRWPDALPQYRVGHVDRVARVLAAVRRHPGLAVCGAALEGVGIAACIASGQAAAQQATAPPP